MKKSISIFALLAIIATGAFAQRFSMAVGGGALLDYSLDNGLNFDYPGYGGFKANVPTLSIGGFGFFDATYAELDVSFAYGMQKLVVTDKWGTGVMAWDIVSGMMGNSFEGGALQLAFTLLGKYPINLGGFTLFPLLGADYNLVLSSWNKNGLHDDSKYTMENMSQFGLLAGTGFDLSFSKALFLRAEALFHLRFPYKALDDIAKTYNSMNIGVTTKATYGMGPNIKIGLGYMLGGNSGSKSSSSSTRNQSGRYMLVNADALNVRSGPSADSALVGTLPRNTRVEVLDRSGTWWKIKSGKIQGYVNSSYLKAE